MIDTIQELLQREFDLNETLMVLKSPINIYWTWGVEKMYNVKNQGLILKVNGHHWKNFVLVTLAWNDTYTVSLLDEDFNISKTNFYWTIVLGVYLSFIGSVFEMYNLQVASNQFQGVYDEYSLESLSISKEYVGGSQSICR